MKRTLGCIGSIAMLAAFAFAVPAVAGAANYTGTSPDDSHVSLDFTVSHGKVKNFHFRHSTAKCTDGTKVTTADWKLAKSPAITHRAFSDTEQRTVNPAVLAHTTVHGKLSKSRKRATGDFKLVYKFVSGQFAGDNCHTAKLDWTATRQ